MTCQLTFLLVCLQMLAIFSIEDYYWRRYHGEDAVIGANAFGYNIYIGRAAFENRGFLVGPVIPGLEYIIVTHWSQVNNDTIHVANEHLEILCSANTTNFIWTNTTSENLLNNAGLVEGGFQQTSVGYENGPLYIGRTTFNDEYVIGKVVGYRKGADRSGNLFYYSNGTYEEYLDAYEVLIHKPQ